MQLWWIMMVVDVDGYAGGGSETLLTIWWFDEEYNWAVMVAELNIWIQQPKMLFVVLKMVPPKMFLFQIIFELH